MSDLQVDCCVWWASGLLLAPDDIAEQLLRAHWVNPDTALAKCANKDCSDHTTVPCALEWHDR